MPGWPRTSLFHIDNIPSHQVSTISNLPVSTMIFLPQSDTALACSGSIHPTSTPGPHKSSLQSSAQSLSTKLQLHCWPMGLLHLYCHPISTWAFGIISMPIMGVLRSHRVINWVFCGHHSPMPKSGMFCRIEDIHRNISLNAIVMTCTKYHCKCRDLVKELLSSQQPQRPSHCYKAKCPNPWPCPTMSALWISVSGYHFRLIL